MRENKLNWQPTEADDWCRFSTAVRQEIESLRGELATWQTSYLTRLRENLASRSEVTSPPAKLIAPAIHILPREHERAGGASDAPRYPSAARNTARDEQGEEDDRLQFLKQRLARQLGTEEGV